MKKVMTIVLAAMMIVGLMAGTAGAEDVEVKTITDGEILYSGTHYLAGEPIPTGFDEYGYNYQAHMFKGSYANSYLGGAGYPAWTGDDEAYLAENPGAASHWAWPYRGITLIMKWSDEWIFNTSIDGDCYLDRHQGYDTYIGSGAWLTNHMKGSYEDESGKKINWTYFTKIVAAPEDAYTDAGSWYTADGDEMGPVIWGSFATVLSVSNDKGAGEHGVIVKGSRPGLGAW